MSKRFSTKLLALLLAVMLIASISTTCVFAGFAGSDSVDVSYASGVFTVMFSADKVADIMRSRSLTKSDLVDMLPTELVSAYRTDGLLGVLTNSAFSSVVSLDQLLAIIPSALITNSISATDIQSVIDVEALVHNNLVDVDAVMNGLSNDQIKEVLKLDELTTADIAQLLPLVKALSATEKKAFLTALSSALDQDTVVGYIMNDATFLEALYNADCIDDLLDVTDVITNKLTTTEQIAAATKTGFEQVKYVIGCLDASELKALVSLSTAIDKIPSDLLVDKVFPSLDKTKLTPTVILQYLDADEIIDAIGFDKLVDIDGLLDSVSLNTFMASVSNKSALYSMINKSELKRVAGKAVLYVLSAMDDVTINGDSVLVDYKISPAAVESAILKALPTNAELTSIPADGILAEFMLHIDFDSSVSEDIDVGLKLGLNGTASSIDLIESKVGEYLTYNVDSEGNSAVIQAVVPMLVSEYITKALNSTTLSDDMKRVVLTTLNGTVAEAIDRVEALTVAEIKNLLIAIGQTEIGNLIDSYPSVADRVRSYALAVLNAVPATQQSLKISAFYEGDGVFNAELNKGVTAKAVLDKIAERFSIVSGVSAYICIDDVVSAAIDATLNFKDLNEVNFTENGVVIFTTYLPQGTDLNKVISLIPALSAHDVWTFTDGSIASVMPETDVEVCYKDSYKATFYNEANEVVGTVDFHYGEKIATTDLPAVPEKTGYTGAWFVDGDEAKSIAGYEYETLRTDVSFKALYSNKTYKVTFEQEDGTTSVVTYLYGDGSVNEPTVNAKFGYDASWEAYTLNVNEEIVVKAKYTPKTFSVIFMQENGRKVTVTYKFGSTMQNIRLPLVSPMKGYTGKWEPFGWRLNKFETIIVKPVYNPETYEVIFVQENGDEEKVSYLFGAESIDEPAINDKTGYHATWESYSLNGNKSITVKAVYLPDTLTVVFEQEDGTKSEVSYTYGMTSVTEPAVNAKEGYTAAWDKYELNKSASVTVKAVYTAKTYTVVFEQEDGTKNEVAYTYGATSVSEPAVAAKEGYSGAWASYELNKSETITVKTIYTLVSNVAWDITDGKLVVRFIVGSADELLKGGVDLSTAFAAAAEEGLSLVVSANGVVLTFDKEAVKEVVASGKPAVTVINPKGNNNYEISLNDITFTKGNVYVDIAYTATDAKKVHVFAVDTEGKKTDLEATYENGVACYKSKALTNCLVEEVTSSNAWVWFVVGAVVVAGGAVTAVVLLNKKSKKGNSK